MEPREERAEGRKSSEKQTCDLQHQGTTQARNEGRYREAVPSLLFWYDYNARFLPWREDPTPYHVWISEIMLQQTRVEAVRAYYDRFLTELPDVQSVAEASEDRLVKLWEGLGYYSRIRNIAKAAKVLCDKHNGQLPADYALLRELPGIGDYTAGAIASIAFGIPVPAVDGNVLRVFARVTGYRGDIRSDSFKKQVGEQLLQAISAYTEEQNEKSRGKCAEEKTIPGAPEAHATKVQSAPGRFNQAVMDLGATVCIPNGKPHCEDCPLSHLCVAFGEDLTAEIPAKTEKKARPVEKRTVLVITDGERVLLHRRPEKGLLAGMWEFPGVAGELSPAAAKKAAAGILRRESEEKGLHAKRLPDSRHVFSHVEWEMRGYRIDVPETIAPEAEYSWATPREIREERGVASAFRTYRDLVLKGI